MKDAPAVTLLVTHYNRSGSLRRLLATFVELGCSFADVVVSDDGSKPEQLDRVRQIQEEYPFRLVLTPVNRGLGHNLNKGQDAVRTPYTLYVQEDFRPTPRFPKAYAAALGFMEESKDLDIVRFWALVKYPYRKPFREGFSRMQFRLWRPGPGKFLCYSDTPHLRRGSFFQRFGRYAEDIPAIKTEKAMAMSFLQARGKGLQCDENDLFIHENPPDEPSTQDYSAHFRLRSKVPAPVFDLAWTTKLTAEYLFKEYRH